MISQTPTGHLQQRIQFNILLITDKRSQTSPLIPFGPPALPPTMSDLTTPTASPAFLCTSIRSVDTGPSPLLSPPAETSSSKAPGALRHSPLFKTALHGFKCWLCLLFLTVR